MESPFNLDTQVFQFPTLFQFQGNTITVLPYPAYVYMIGWDYWVVGVN